MDSPFKNFAEFWPYYLYQHRKASTRWFHFLGTSGAMATLVAAVVLRQPWLVLLAPVVGYGLAWPSHLFLEQNRPATFKHPWWSFAADLKMWWLMLTGRLGRELARCSIEAPPQRRAA